MRDDVRAAIENSRSVGIDAPMSLKSKRRRFGLTRAIVLAVCQELDSDMTIGELVDELQIAVNQDGE